MEQPSNAGGEDGGAKEEVAELELERKKSSDQETDPSPKSTEANGEQQNEKQKSENDSSTTSKKNEDINRNNINNESTETGSDKLASPLNSKSKKSVRWSEELVSESPEPRSRMVSFPEEHGSNPYVAHSPAPSDNSSSINIKGKLFFFPLLLIIIRIFLETLIMFLLFVGFDVFLDAFRYNNLIQWKMQN